MSPRVFPATFHEPETAEYQWVFANGHLQVSPLHSHQELLEHAGLDVDHDGPVAMGEIEVQAGLAGWSVVGNISLRYLSKILQDYTRDVGWRWGGLIDHVDQVPIDDQFGPKKSRKTMHWYKDSDQGPIKFANRWESIPLPGTKLGGLAGKTYRLGSFEYDDQSLYLVSQDKFLADPDYNDPAGAAIRAFAQDTGREIKVADYPGAGEHLNLNDKLKKNSPMGEDLELYNLGDNSGEDPQRPSDDDPGRGPWRTRDGKEFTDWGEYLIHVQELNAQTDDSDLEDEKFPKAPNLDLGIPNNWHPRQPFVMPLATKQAALQYPPFEESDVPDGEILAAFRPGDGIVAMRVGDWSHGSPDGLRVIEEWKRPRMAAPQPKDQLKDPVPFIYDIDADKLAVGHPGTRHSDIPGKFTPGGIVEGTYEPGGQVVVRSMTNMPWTARHLADLWYWSYPQMEITGIQLEDAEGNTTKLASDKLDTVQVAQTLRANLLADPAAHLASQALQGAGGRVFIVGGAVRDVLLGKQPNDIDLMVSGLSPEQVDLTLSRLLGRMDLTGKHFGVYRYTRRGHEVEVALPRVETSTGDTQKDFDAQISGDIPVEQDLGRRDFTANALAFDVQTNQIIDPHGGIEDIQNGVLRPVFNDTFKEDPTRLLRALTAHTKHGLEPDQATVDQMTRESGRITNEPRERVQKELDKIFGTKDPHRAIELAKQTGLLDHIFPEAYQNWDFDQKNPHHSQTLGDHLNHVLRNTAQDSDDPDLRLAALLHDIGKPASQWIDENGVAHYYRGKDGQGDDHARVGARMAAERLRALKYPTARIDRIKHLINNHMFATFSSEKGARKFLNRVGDQHADDLLTLRHADQYGKAGPAEDLDNSVERMRGLVQRVREQGQPQSIRDLAINGKDIIDLGIKPGPQIGQVLQHLTDRVIDDPQMNQRQPLLDAATEYLNGGSQNATM